MISDILSEAIIDMDEYLNLTDPIYTGAIGVRVREVRAEMEALRILLDTPPPFIVVPGEYVNLAGEIVGTA